MPRAFRGESAAPLMALGEKRDCDVAVIGAGAAGMMAAARAGQRGRRVVLIDHYAKIGEKIRISGGGRCNFTNIHSTHRNFISRNLDFCRSGLRRYSPRQFVALVTLSFDEELLARYGYLAGVSTDVEAECHGGRFRENLLFTHRGLSGPAILQVSSYWQEAEAAEPIRINLIPGVDARAWLAEERRANATLATLLAQRLPKRFAQQWCEAHGVNLPVVQLSDRAIADAVRDLTDWRVQPSGTLGYQKAEVTLGGVDSRGLSSMTMEAHAMPGRYFIGEGVDVTGHIRGHNFQWALASGHAAGEAI